jgi:hypothetical protein
MPLFARSFFNEKITEKQSEEGKEQWKSARARKEEGRANWRTYH